MLCIHRQLQDTAGVHQASYDSWSPYIPASYGGSKQTFLTDLSYKSEIKSIADFITIILKQFHFDPFEKNHFFKRLVPLKISGIYSDFVGRQTGLVNS